MANSKFQAQPSHVVLTISLTCFLLLLNVVNSESFHAFSFPKFVPNQPNLILQGDALITSTGKLQLTEVDERGTPVSSSLGRALYSAPIQIWDSSTGKVASFITSFSFVIDAPDEKFTADGIAFFLAPPDTKPLTNGGFLGLFRDRFYNESYQTVAVEFDTCYNFRWDPEGLHLGIDVNTIKSTQTASWGFVNGQVANVLITYQASTQTLFASINYPSTKTSYSVSDTVDLKSVLPEWVRVGFSATSGLDPRHIETHDVHSWSFLSTFADSFSDALKENPHIASYLPTDLM